MTGGKRIRRLSARRKRASTMPKGPLPPHFHLFVVDSGWRSEAADILHENLELIQDFAGDCPVFVLNREQSRQFCRSDPHLIGRDPSLIVHDLRSSGADRPGYRGLRLNLGMTRRRDEALALLQEFLRFLLTHSRSPDIEQDLRRVLHRQGLFQALEVLSRQG